jgi:hypothetical protein
VRLWLAIAVVGVIMDVVGLVWLGQGIGWIGGSFMTGETTWAVIGAGFVVFGGLVLRGALRLRTAAPPEND